jgi:hypothetical protein
LGSEVVLIVGAALMVMDRASVAVAPLLPATWTVKLDMAAVVGVPEITPAELSDNPAGRAPELIDQV